MRSHAIPPSLGTGIRPRPRWIGELRRQGRASSARAALVALVTLTATLVQPARAQVPSSPVIDPIPASALVTMAEALRLSRDQQAAVLAFHDAYAEACRSLRADVIEPASAQLLAALRTMDPRAIDAAVRAVEQAQQRGADQDARFLDQVRGVLTPEQVERLPRIRMRRERDRATQSFAIFAGLSLEGGAIELDPLIRRLPGVVIAPDVLPAVEKALEAYETPMTAALQHLSREGFRAMGSLTTRAAQSEAAQGGAATADHRRDHAYNAMLEQMGAMQARQAAVRRDTRAHVRDTANRLASIIGGHQGRHVRVMCLMSAWPDLYQIVSWPGTPDLVHTTLAAAAVMDESAARTAILDAAESAASRLDRLIPEAIDMLEARDRPGGAGVDPRAAHAIAERALGRLTEAAEEARSALVLVLKDALGARWLPELTRLVMTPPGTADDRPPTAPDAEGPDEAFAFFDWTRPTRLRRQDLRRILEALTLRDDERARVRDVVGAYLDHAGTLESADRLRTALDQAQPRRRPDDAARVAPTPATFRELAEFRRRAMEDRIAHDRAFFMALAGALTDPAQARLITVLGLLHDIDLRNRAPQRDATVLVHDPGATAVLPIVVHALRVGASEPQVPALLEAYATQVGPVARNILRSGIEFERLRETWSLIESGAAPADDASAPTPDDLMREMTTHAQAIRTDRAAIRTRLRALVQDLMRALPADAALDVERAFHQSAYPMELGTVARLPGYLGRAVALPSLTPAQRADLEELAAHHHEACRTLMRTLTGLIDAVADRDPPSGATDQAQLAAFRARQQQDAERHRIEQDLLELLHRAEAALRVVLTEAQRAELGPPPGKHAW